MPASSSASPRAGLSRAGRSPASRCSERLESHAFELGGGDYCAPGQLVGDFLRGVPSTDARRGRAVVQAGRAPRRPRRRRCPTTRSRRSAKRCPAFGRQIAGFDRDDAVLTGVETRTSSPVRITRDHETLQSLNMRGLYPAGEGAGYAGGILSAGVDGIKVAEAVARSMLNKTTFNHATKQ